MRWFTTDSKGNVREITPPSASGGWTMLADRGSERIRAGEPIKAITGKLVQIDLSTGRAVPRCICASRILNQPCPVHHFSDEGIQQNAALAEAKRRWGFAAIHERPTA